MEILLAGRLGQDGRCPVAYFRDHEVHSFTIQSSFGMVGWILAKRMEKISRSGQIA
jgi:hypothetical protein